MLAIPAIFTAALILVDEEALILWWVVLALPFLMIATVRLVAVWYVIRRQPKHWRGPLDDRRFDAPFRRFPCSCRCTRKKPSYQVSSPRCAASIIRPIASKFFL